MLPDLTSVEIKNNYRLLLQFSNGERRIFDVKPYLNRGKFKELKIKKNFSAVELNEGYISWRNSAGLGSEFLYLRSKKFTKSIINTAQSH